MKRFSYLISAAVWTNRATWITVMLLLFSASVLAADPENLLLNGHFEDGIENWEILLAGGGQMEAIMDDSDSVKGSQCVYLDLIQLGGSAGFWEIKLGQVVLGLIEQGQMYTLSVWAKADEGARQIRPHLRIGAGGASPFDSTHAQTFDIITEWAEYSHSFSAGGEPDGLVDIALGTTLGNLWMDNIRLYEGQYAEDPDLGRTQGGKAVDRIGKLATKWGEIRSMSL